MPVRIKLMWDDNNTTETGHNIYRSNAPMDPEALPAALITLGADVVEYLDEAVTEGQTYYYRVGAFSGSEELVSEEVSAVASVVATHWIATLGGANADSSSGYRTVGVDASDNIYVAGHTASIGAGSNDLLIAKYTASGDLLWQCILGGAGDDYARSIAVDSAGNVYIAGATSSQGAGSNDLLLVKYDTSGVLQWQRRLGGSSADYGYGITVNGSSVYVVGDIASQGAGSNDLLLVKYDTSGVLQWQRTLGGISSDYGASVAVDFNGYVYVSGMTGSYGQVLEVLLAKWNSSGSLQWQRVLYGSGFEYGNGLVVDSLGNLYIAGSTDASGGAGANALLVKYNTNGTLQWQQTLGGSGVDQFFAAVMHSSGLYVIGNTASEGAGSNDTLIARYATDGTLQWQRVLGGTGNDFGRGIAIDSTGVMVISGSTVSAGQGSNDMLLARLPNDGSLTGTYGAFTYAAATLTDAPSNLTSATSSLSAGTVTLTAATSTLTDSAGTLTPAKTVIS